LTDQEFFEKAEKHFRFLITQYGFAVTERIKAVHFDNRYIAFSSQECQVAVYVDRGYVELSVCLASLANDPSNKEGRHSWGLETIIGFLTEPTDSEILASFDRDLASFDKIPGKSIPYELEIEGQLADLAERMQPYCPPIFSLFQSDIYYDTLKELDAFRARQHALLMEKLTSRVRNT